MLSSVSRSGAQGVPGQARAQAQSQAPDTEPEPFMETLWECGSQKLGCLWQCSFLGTVPTFSVWNLGWHVSFLRCPQPLIPGSSKFFWWGTFLRNHCRVCNMNQQLLPQQPLVILPSHSQELLLFAVCLCRCMPSRVHKYMRIPYVPAHIHIKHVHSSGTFLQPALSVQGSVLEILSRWQAWPCLLLC